MRVFLLCLSTLLGFFVISSAEPITIEYRFDTPQIENISLGGQVFDRVVMKDVPNCGNPGDPSLPALGARILIPYGTDVSSIEISIDDHISLGTGFHIEPVGIPVRLSSDPSAVRPPVPNPAVYGSNHHFPEMLYENIGIQSFRGYSILTLKLHPVRYHPQSGAVDYFSSLRVIVNTVKSDRKTDLYRGYSKDESEINSMIDNPETVASYWAAPAIKSRSYDMLIITTATLAGSFQPLKDYHDTTGILTEIHTTDDIGSSSPDDIRDYIRERYLSDGIEYVIIGADDDIIAAKDLYVLSYEGGDVEYNMPSDIYYACLDGGYNNDGDTYWGEPNDGEGGGDVDLIAEVYVGRASVGNTAEADRFVDKTIWYLTKQHTKTDKVLLVGEHLGFGGIGDYANAYMDELEDGSSSNGYTTVGIPSDQYTIDKLYDYDWPGNNWPQSEIINRINSGQHIVNHLGHGSPDYAMKLFDSDVYYDLTNDDLCFVYSQTCLAGHLDGTDCWAEYMNIKTDFGGFAAIMNARYGWGTGYSTDGPSQRFNREFWDAVFNPVEAKPEIGRANHDSKEDNLYRIGDGCMRWCYYELNLFGDPTISIRGVNSLAFSYPNGIPETIPPGQTNEVEVVVSGIGEGVPVGGSGQLHYILNGGVVQSLNMTEFSPNRYEANLPAVGCNDTLEFYFSADEIETGTIYYPDSDLPFCPIVASDVTTIMVDNFESNQGWTVSGTVSDGAWDRGIPAGGGDRGDPPYDFDGSGQCFLTDNVDGNSDVDDGTTILTSPLFDLSSGDATIHYARWYSNSFGDDPNNDEMYVYITNDDGANWALVETVGPVDQASGGWFEHSFKAGDILQLTALMRVRFDVSDLNNGSVVEAGIDDFSVVSYECVEYVCGDANADLVVNIIDITYIIAYLYDNGPEPQPMDAADVNGSSDINIMDVTAIIENLYFDGEDLSCY